MLQSPIVHQPTIFNIGPIELTGFGLAVVLAFVISQIIAQQELRRRGHIRESDAIPDLIIAAVLGTLIGGKLYYALLNNDLSLVFNRAGLVFWGGLMGGMVVVAFVIVRKKLNLPRIADVAGICVGAGYAIGRTGCWAVGDDYGKPWSGPLAVQFPDGLPPSTAAVMESAFGVEFPAGTAPNEVIAVHPTQLYETAMGLVMFGILWRLRDHKHAEGWLFGVYCVLAGVERFIIEFFRAKDDRFFGIFTMAQMIAMGFVALGVGLMYALNTPRPGRPGIHAAASV